MTAATDDVTTLLEPLALVRAANLGRSEPVRSWIPVGTVDAAAIGDVDGAGLVQMRGATWSLDWWVGAEDRWHHPSREAAVRQRCLGSAPIVETAMRVPGGDVVHRAFGVRASSPLSDGAVWEDSAVVVEIENLTSVPVALALSFRPVALDGPGRITTIGSDGPVISVDGRVAAVISKPPARMAAGRLGEPSELLSSGTDAEPGSSDRSSGDDRTEVAYVVALPHTSVVRIMLPRVTEAPRRRRSAPVPDPGPDWDAPTAETVESGWQVHSRTAARVELPDATLDDCVVAAQRALLVAATDDFIGDLTTGAGPRSGTDRSSGDGTNAAWRAAEVCDALVRSGLSEPLGPLARGLASLQRLGGAVTLEDGSDATVALLHAAAPLLVGSNSEVWVEDLLGPVAKAIHRVGKGRGLDDGRLSESATAALDRLAPSMRQIGQPDVADAAEAAAFQLASTPTPLADPAAGGTTEHTAATAGRLRQRIRSGDTTAVADLQAFGRVGLPGWMPDAVSADGVPCGSTGFSAGAVAGRLNAVLDLALLEGRDGPVVLPAWPEQWWGQAVEAHAVVTRWGRVSFALRWHGERPAILWEIEPADGVDADAVTPIVTAPVLDRAWSGTGWVGEALLAPIATPESLVAISSPRAAAAEPTAPVDPPAQDVPPPPAEGQSFS